MRLAAEDRRDDLHPVRRATGVCQSGSCVIVSRATNGTPCGSEEKTCPGPDDPVFNGRCYHTQHTCQNGTCTANQCWKSADGGFCPEDIIDVSFDEGILSCCPGYECTCTRLDCLVGSRTCLPIQ